MDTSVSNYNKLLFKALIYIHIFIKLTIALYLIEKKL